MFFQIASLPPFGSSPRSGIFTAPLPKVPQRTGALCAISLTGNILKVEKNRLAVNFPIKVNEDELWSKARMRRL